MLLHEATRDSSSFDRRHRLLTSGNCKRTTTANIFDTLVISAAVEDFKRDGERLLFVRGQYVDESRYIQEKKF